MQFTFKFKDENQYKSFVETVNADVEDGEMKKVPTPESLRRFIKVGEHSHLVEETEGNLVAFYLGAPYHEHSLTVQTEYGDYTYYFKLYDYKSKRVFENDKDSIVYFRIEYNKEQPESGALQTLFTYKTNPNKAKSVEELHLEYNRAKHLLKKIFKSPTPKEIDNAITSLEKLEQYWQRIHEVETALHISFNPENINDNASDEGNIEKLYLLLVKKYAIRQNLKDAIYSAKYDSTSEKTMYQIGQGIRMSGTITQEYEIYGETFEVHEVRVTFNSVIDAIEDNEAENELIIKCKGSDIAPIYVSYKGFITLDEANEAIKDFDSYETDYKNAKTFNELMEEQIYKSPIRLKSENPK